MSSRRRLSIAAGLPLVLAVFAVSVPAQTQTTTPDEPRPIIVSVEAEPNVFTDCPVGGSGASRRVRLRARASSPDGETLRYGAWTVSEGRIEGTGENVVWDLSGVPRGTYTARVAVESEKRRPDGNPVCEAFNSVVVVVHPCPPPRAHCPNVSISCPDTVVPGQPVTFTANFSGGTPGVAAT